MGIDIHPTNGWRSNVIAKRNRSEKKMNKKYPGPLVSANWLHEHLEDSDICVVDASVHLPDTGRDAKQEYLSEHIPKAIFFDLSDIADPSNPLPRKVPAENRFCEKVGELGIDNTTHVVAYDTPGLYSAARVWWLFKLYGYDNVSILDGGMANWKLSGLSVTDKIIKRPSKKFEAGKRRDVLALSQEVLLASSEGKQILDARTPGRFAGTELDRYPGTRPGHIPGSTNLYWGDLLDKESRTMFPEEQLKEIFTHTQLDLDRPIILTCGSGLTACILALGLSKIGKHNWSVYDGSWDEWGRNHQLPVECSD